MSEKLTADELVALVKGVFAPGPSDAHLAVLVDLPDEAVSDRPAWKERRALAAEWAGLLAERRGELGLARVTLVHYRNARANNANLPPAARPFPGGALPESAADLGDADVPFDRIFETHQILIALTELSATAPLKLAAREHRFRAATMPGFGPEMIPALRLDFGRIAARVDRLKALLDEAERCTVDFATEEGPRRLVLDLRHRTAHASTGLLREPGTAGNLPSGEAYIVPYEGEIAGTPSLSSGEIPVQLGEDIVVYRVEGNRAVAVLGRNAASASEADRLAAEPAYGNLAELGLGVLGELGVEPVGEVLLDEKLGLHIAFGRSEHFGGQVGPAAFSAPERVVHIDRVYVEKLQPRVRVASAVLALPGGREVPLMREGRYVIPFEA